MGIFPTEFPSRREFISGATLIGAVGLIFGPPVAEHLVQLLGRKTPPKTQPAPPAAPTSLPDIPKPPGREILDRYAPAIAIKGEGASTTHELIRVLNTNGIAARFVQEAKAGMISFPHPPALTAIVEVAYMERFANLPDEDARRRFLGTSAAGLIDGITTFAASRIRIDQSRPLAVIISPGHQTAVPNDVEEYRRVNKIRIQRGYRPLIGANSDTGTSEWIKGREITEKEVVCKMATEMASQINKRGNGWIPILSSSKSDSIPVASFRDPVEKYDEFLFDQAMTIIPLQLQEEMLAAGLTQTGMDVLIINLHLEGTDDPRITKQQRQGGRIIYPSFGAQAATQTSFANNLATGLRNRLSQYAGYDTTTYPNDEAPLYWYFAATQDRENSSLGNRVIDWLRNPQPPTWASICKKTLFHR